jgi:hypothetical protein
MVGTPQRRVLPFPCHPVESQCRHEKEKYQHDAQQDEEQQSQSAEFFFVDFEKMGRPRGSRVPEQSRREEIEQGEYEADDKGAKEKVPEENDLFAFHTALQ